MAFWGVEVKPGQSLKVDADEVIHISQASLGEVKDDSGAKNVLLRMKVGKENFVIGSLSAGERPQIMCDLYLNKEFELSHDLKSGSVYFLGYSEPPQFGEETDSDDTSESEEDLPINALEKDKPEVKAANGLKQEEKKKAATRQVLSKKPALKPSKPAVEDHDPDEDDDSDDDDFGSEDSDESMEDGDSSDEAESEEDDSDEETPVPMEQTKKRKPESVVATKAPQKNAKQTPPQKTVAKKVASAKQPKTPNSINSSNKSKKKSFPRKL
ncbi:unnamed protein product [Cuscuta europaea]|uniref:Nucleoplasmin-like domain-containing protein n=1 Tax=Cuscuta europaea TaxID=41803 RepID=A0A9P0YPZ7_CUSEU|nr:unnamed protein product [Cuscuta europaea]